MTNPRFVFGVDLDGVCADFYAGLRPIAAEWLGVDVNTLPERVSWGLPEWGIDKAPGGYEALHRFAVTQRELFRQLPPMPGAPQALRKLSKADIRIRIITHRFFIKYFHQVAARRLSSGALLHADYRVAGHPRHPLLGSLLHEEKSAVGADLYIEDSPKNIERLRDEGQKTIVFTNSTNEDLPEPRADNWDEVVKMVLDEKRAREKGRASAVPSIYSSARPELD